MSDIPVSDLSGVHAAIQQALNDLIADGVAVDDVIEAALTVAVANQMKVYGPREASRALMLVAEFLAAQADAQEHGARRHGN